MRKYLFLAFVMLFFKEITTFESEERDDRRDFRQCKTCICNQGTKKETYDKTSFDGQCDIRCASRCANQELRLKKDRSKGNSSRWGQKHDAMSGNFRRTPVLWNSILLLFIIAIFCNWNKTL